MAELTPLEEKLAEVIGLAQASQQVTGKVAKLPEADDDVRELLERLGEDAKQVADRGQDIAASLEGRKTAIEDKARETKQELSEMAKTYLDGADVDALDGFEFLVMAEAGELGHVEVLEKINEQVRDEAIDDLVRFAKPIEERHVREVRERTLALAAQEGAEA
jgi:hypothetical protein